MNRPTWAMAATGQGSLRSRIERLLQPSRPRLHLGLRPNLGASPLLVLGLALLTGCAITGHALQSATSVPKELQFIQHFLAEKGIGGLILPLEDRQMSIQLHNQALSLEVEGAPRPIDELLPYTHQIKSYLRTMEEWEIAKTERKLSIIEQRRQSVHAQQLALEQAAAEARQKQLGEMEKAASELERQAQSQALAQADLALMAKARHVEAEQLTAQLALLSRIDPQEKQEKLAELQAATEEHERNAEHLRRELAEATRRNQELTERLRALESHAVPAAAPAPGAMTPAPAADPEPAAPAPKAVAPPAAAPSPTIPAASPSVVRPASKPSPATKPTPTTKLRLPATAPRAVTTETLAPLERHEPLPPIAPEAPTPTPAPTPKPEQEQG